ncbi:MAG: RsmB/NOP family class I SAM-dependent RNA methyltransferase [Pseudomonadota bacterium]
MTPAARIAAAIEIVDGILAGTPAEAALLNWARGHRFAGSKDRAALRDIVFSVMRQRASCAFIGGAQTGRALLRGYLAQEGTVEDTIFGQGPYGPPALTSEDPPLRERAEMDEPTRHDLQPWVWEAFSTAYPDASAIAEALRHRAPLWVRVNTARATREAVLTALEDAGHAPEPSETCSTAIRIAARERQLSQHPLFASGAIEIQDLAPQAAVLELPDARNWKVLDFCAGGGGKSLALAARGAEVTAHDANPRRMADLPKRATRAGIQINVTASPTVESYDMVVCDVPCSGSGAWRRSMDTKWTLTTAGLSAYVERQRKIVVEASEALRVGGVLSYMTCSLFPQENAEQASWIATSLTNFELEKSKQWTPLDGGDGFYSAVFRRIR